MPPQIQSSSVQAAQWNTAYVDSLPNSSFAWTDDKGERHLPYKDKDGKVDLPHTRNALARLNQVKDMPSDERDKIRTKLQSALKNTKAADDMIMRGTHAVMADDSGTLPTRVMLLRSGEFNTQKYGVVPLAATDLHEMKTNFEAGIGMAGDGSTGLPIDYHHESNRNAAGWIKGLSVEADGADGVALWADPVEWSGSGQKALTDKEYKCLSSDFYPSAFGEWVDAESGLSTKNVIVGAALTNRPMFTGNQTVQASDTDNPDSGGVTTIIHVNASENKEQKMNLDKLRVKAAEDLTGAEYKFIAEHKGELSADEQKKFSLEATRAEGTPPKQVNAAEVTGEEGLVSVQAADLKAQNEKISSLEASVTALQSNVTASDREVVLAGVKKHAARGAIKADRVDSWTDRIVAADEAGRKELLADLSALADNPALAATQGSSDAQEGTVGDARKQLMDKATEVVKASGGKTSIQEALESVKGENPELATQAADERKNNMQVQASDAEFAAAGVNRG